MFKEENLAIIPARGGSKRIPRKNIKPFLGKPIIAYSIEAAINSGLYSDIMVSTDDEEIAEVSIKYGANVPFFRSKENSNDFAGTAEVINEVINEYEKVGKKYKSISCIYPTAPFINPTLLKESFELLNNNAFDIVFPVLKYSYPIQRSLEFKNNNLVMLWPENYTKRSQDLKPIYHDAGQFYTFSKDYMVKANKLFSDKSGGIIISELLAQDIDNEDDWKLAELKYKEHLLSKQ